jgi:translation initiation factor 2D
VPNHAGQEVDQNDQVAASPSLGEIRNSLLPEGSQSARFITTAGPNLSQVSGTVYVGVHPGQEQRILWIKVEERLVPTGRVS